jgi:radical SAM superfamily enzyme with C-terminal helix-hairpin-helix motif
MTSINIRQVMYFKTETFTIDKHKCIDTPKNRFLEYAKQNWKRVDNVTIRTGDLNNPL